MLPPVRLTLPMLPPMCLPPCFHRCDSPVVAAAVRIAQTHEVLVDDLELDFSWRRWYKNCSVMLIFVNVPIECGARGLSEVYSVTLNHHTVIPAPTVLQTWRHLYVGVREFKLRACSYFSIQTGNFSYLISSDFFGTTLFQWSDSGGGGWMWGWRCWGWWF